MPKNAIYSGIVFHKRFLPKIHSLKYNLFQLLINLKDPPPNKGLFSCNKFNLVSFFDIDHGPFQGETNNSLLVRIQKLLLENNIFHAQNEIFLLAMPRILGFVFNPISTYFIIREDKIIALLYEVNNTFGDRHTYIIITDGSKHNSIKQMHVSPFMDMDMYYEFKTKIPDENLSLLIDLYSNKNEKYLATGFNAKQKEFTSLNLLKETLKMPFMTLGVVFAIHYEALKIFIKKIGYRHKPITKKSSVSITQSSHVNS